MTCRLAHAKLAAACMAPRYCWPSLLWIGAQASCLSGIAAYSSPKLDILRVSEIKSKSNAKQISFPRQVAMYLCKQLTDLSYPDIGRQFNDKHHSTVMYSVDKIEKLRATDSDLDRTLESIAQHFS